MGISGDEGLVDLGGLGSIVEGLVDLEGLGRIGEGLVDLAEPVEETARGSGVDVIDLSIQWSEVIDQDVHAGTTNLLNSILNHMRALYVSNTLR